MGGWRRKDDLTLPADLVDALSRGDLTFEAGYYGTVTLIPLDKLKVETLEVTPNMAPFVSTHPHADEYGHYAVPAVNLIQSGEKREGSFPAWLFLWLPTESRYGSYDLDHGDLLAYDPKVTWSDIAADPAPYLRASDGEHDGTVSIEYLEPWHCYEFVPVEMPE
jgi:hypothetical protein